MLSKNMPRYALPTKNSILPSIFALLTSAIGLAATITLVVTWLTVPVLFEVVHFTLVTDGAEHPTGDAIIIFTLTRLALDLAPQEVIWYATRALKVARSLVILVKVDDFRLFVCLNSLTALMDPVHATLICVILEADT